LKEKGNLDNELLRKILNWNFDIQNFQCGEHGNGKKRGRKRF